MRMAFDHFLSQSIDDVRQIKSTFVGGNLSVEYNLQQKIPQFFNDMFIIA